MRPRKMGSQSGRAIGAFTSARSALPSPLRNLVSFLDTGQRGAVLLARAGSQALSFINEGGGGGFPLTIESIYDEISIG